MIRTLALASLAVLALAACSPKATAPDAATQATGPAAGTAPTPAMAAYTADASKYFSGGQPITPQEVTAMIAADGAQPTVVALYEPEATARWNTVMAGVAAADPAWLALVKPLEPGTENSTAYDLNAALKAAMVVNPTAVLTLLDTANEDLSPYSICYLDGIEMEPAQYAAYYDALTPAVESVTDPALADKKAECLTILRAREGA